MAYRENTHAWIFRNYVLWQPFKLQPHPLQKPCSPRRHLSSEIESCPLNYQAKSLVMVMEKRKTFQPYENALKEQRQRPAGLEYITSFTS
jgi:hypothetical protein